MPMAPNGGAPPFARQIDLSNEQREKVGDILLTMRDQSAQMADELQLARRTLHREAFADKRDEKKVADITAKIVAFEKQLLDIHVKSQAAISDTLTPKQREMVRTSGNAFGGPGGPGTPGGPAGRGGGVQR
jgi:Spy/CpxP family protein refolding chaperone